MTETMQPAHPPQSSVNHIHRRFLLLIQWLFSLQPSENRPTDPVKTLYRSIHITAKCRFNASIRLRRVGQFSFLTATFLSLGLILLPMLQLSGIQLAYPDRVLSMLEIFLAVAVLVYSVINSTAHYETRSGSLNECGDKIKELSRELRTAMSSSPPDEKLDLDQMNRRYTDISTESENHTRSDYWQAMIQARGVYNITGIPRFWLYAKINVARVLPYLIPVFLLLAELIILLDVLAVTSVLTPHLIMKATVNPTP